MVLVINTVKFLKGVEVGYWRQLQIPNDVHFNIFLNRVKRWRGLVILIDRLQTTQIMSIVYSPLYLYNYSTKETKIEPKI